jgi:hypothetical protein
VGTDVPAPPHTTHECADPRPLIDAMDGAASLPLRLDRDVEILQVVVVLRPRSRPTYVVVRINGHDVFSPSDVLLAFSLLCRRTM